MVNREVRLGTAEIERLVCDPIPLGSVETLVPRVEDAWQLSFPRVSSLPAMEGERRPLKVCIATEDIVGPVRNGGIGTTYAALAHLLASLGIDTTILYLKGNDVENGTVQQWIDHYGKSGIHFVPVPNYAMQDNFRTGSDRWLRAPYNMMRYLLEHPMDVVHVSEWRGSGYLSLLAKRQGLAFQDTLFITKTSSPWIWNRLYGSQPLDRLEDLAKVHAERASVEYADMVIGGSLHLLKWMASQGYRIPRDRTFVQPNVISFDHLQGLISKRQSTPGTRRPIDEFVFFGRLEARKGLFTFCQAIKRLIRLGVKLPPKISFMGKPGARLTARPDQDILDYIASETASWPVEIAVLTEFQQYEALEYLLSGERLAVMPSMIENSSLAVYEAAMCGIPFVASSSGGTPELVAEVDHDHVLCDAHPLTLADKLAEAIELGGYVAHPSFDNDANLEEWRRFHIDLSRGLKDHMLQRTSVAETAPATVSVCVYHTGDLAQLRATLASLRAQSEPAQEIVVAVDADQGEATAAAAALIAELKMKAELLDAFDYDAGLAFNTAAGQTTGDFLFFVWAGATLKPECLATLAKLARSSRADVVSYFTRVTHGATPSHQDHLRAQIFTSFTEAFFRTDLTALPLYVRREAFVASNGFSYDYRVLGCEHEFVARAQVSGFRCETALVELGTVPAWDKAWLREKCYDQPISQFRAIRPHLAAVPLAMRELVLMAKGLQSRGGQSGGKSSPWIASFKAARKNNRNPVARLFELVGLDSKSPRVHLPAVIPSPVYFEETKAKLEEEDRSLLSMSRHVHTFKGRSGTVYRGGVFAVRDGTIYGWLRRERDSETPVELALTRVDGSTVRPIQITRSQVELVSENSIDLGNCGFGITVFRSGPLARFATALEHLRVTIPGEDVVIAELHVTRPGLNLEKAGLQGFCDEGDRGFVRGWVWNPSRPNVGLDVAVFIDGLFFTRVSAVSVRDDLIANGVGEGHYGFSVQVPKELRDGTPHTIEVYVADYGLRLKRGRLKVVGDLVTHER